MENSKIAISGWKEHHGDPQRQRGQDMDAQNTVTAFALTFPGLMCSCKLPCICHGLNSPTLFFSFPLACLKIGVACVFCFFVFFFEGQIQPQRAKIFHH